MWTLRLFYVVCLYVGVRSLGIAGTTLSQLERYRTLEAAGSPIVRAGIYALFGVLFFLSIWGLHQRNERIIQALLPLLIAYTGFDLIWLWLFAQSDFARGRFGFLIVTSIVGLGLLMWQWMRLKKQLLENGNP